ncbi:MAG: hypothetical protein AAFY17_01345 [Cyanobacteria bacterium J06642_11]
MTTLAQSVTTPIQPQEPCLWGAHSSPENISAATPQATDMSTYVYTPGDSCNVINASDGINLLWLRHIQATEVSLRATRHGKLQVHYRNEPILRMVGVQTICTDDGCFRIDHLLTKR